jgi:hypothetical protein
MTEIQVLAQDLMISRTIMLTSILMAIVTVVFSSITMAFERSYNVKSLRPFVNLLQVFDQQTLSLSIENAGLGPMLIERVSFVLKEGSDQAGKAIEAILPGEREGLGYFNYPGIYSLAARGKLTLLDCKNLALLPDLAKSLADYSICVEYRDVYDHGYKKSYPILW